MNIPKGAMSARKENDVPPSHLEVAKNQETFEEKITVIKDKDYGILDWVRVLLILTIPIVNIIALILWIAKRQLNRTAGNFAAGFIIYLCIMIAIGAIYYFFMM